MCSSFRRATIPAAGPLFANQSRSFISMTLGLAVASDRLATGTARSKGSRLIALSLCSLLRANRDLNCFVGHPEFPRKVTFRLIDLRRE
jgi:hypothetical protein